MMGSARAKMLMAVYGVLACDGRVQRAANALAESSDLTVVGISSQPKGPVDGLRCRVCQVRLPRFTGFGPFRLALFWMVFFWMAVRTKPHVVYAHDFFMLLPGWVVSRSMRAKLVYDAHELIIPEGRRYKSLSHRVFSFVERQLVWHADVVIVADKTRAQIMKDYYRLPTLPVVVRNIASRPQMAPNGCHTRLPEDGRIRLVYQGAMSLSRGIDRFIKALKYLDDRFELILVGDGPDAATLLRVAAMEQVASRVTSLGRVTVEELCTITSQCNIGIVAYSPVGWNNLYCAPNKVFEYAQAGIPIIATDQPALQELVEGSGIGVTVKAAGDAEQRAHEYANSIQYLAQNAAVFRSKIPQFLAAHSWDNESRKLLKCIDALSQDSV